MPAKPAKPQASQLASDVSLPMAFGQSVAAGLGRVGARAAINKILPPLPAKVSPAIAIKPTQPIQH